MKFCFFNRHNWNKTINRKQSCKNCGFVRTVTCPHNWEIVRGRLTCEDCGDVKGDCLHVWNVSATVETTNLLTKAIIRITDTLQCKFCGDMKTHIR